MDGIVLLESDNDNNIMLYYYNGPPWITQKKTTHRNECLTIQPFMVLQIERWTHYD